MDKRFIPVGIDTDEIREGVTGISRVVDNRMSLGLIEMFSNDISSILSSYSFTGIINLNWLIVHIKQYYSLIPDSDLRNIVKFIHNTYIEENKITEQEEIFSKWIELCSITKNKITTESYDSPYIPIDYQSACYILMTSIHSSVSDRGLSEFFCIELITMILACNINNIPMHHKQWANFIYQLYPFQFIVMREDKDVWYNLYSGCIYQKCALNVGDIMSVTLPTIVHNTISYIKQRVIPTIEIILFIQLVAYIDNPSFFEFNNNLNNYINAKEDEVAISMINLLSNIPKYKERVYNLIRINVSPDRNVSTGEETLVEDNTKPRNRDGSAQMVKVKAKIPYLQAILYFMDRIVETLNETFKMISDSKSYRANIEEQLLHIYRHNSPIISMDNMKSISGGFLPFGKDRGKCFYIDNPSGLIMVRDVLPCDYFNNLVRTEYPSDGSLDHPSVQFLMTWFHQMFGVVTDGKYNRDLTEKSVNYFFGKCAQSLNKNIASKTIIMLVGCGDNGKSRLSHLFKCCFGSYFKELGAKFIASGIDISRPQPALVDAIQSNIIWVSEVEGISISESLIKMISGSDEIHLRDLFSRGGSYRFCGPMVFAANRYPRLKFSKAMENRVIVIDINAVWSKPNAVPKREQERYDQLIFPQDDSFMGKIEQVSGYFLWLLVYFYNRTRANNINIPNHIKENTERYWNEVDNFRYFCNRTFIGKSHPDYKSKSISIEWLHQYYIRWLSKYSPNAKPISIKDFINNMNEASLKPTRTEPIETWDNVFYVKMSMVDNTDPFGEILREPPDFNSTSPTSSASSTPKSSSNSSPIPSPARPWLLPISSTLSPPREVVTVSPVPIHIPVPVIDPGKLKPNFGPRTPSASPKFIITPRE